MSAWLAQYWPAAIVAINVLLGWAVWSLRSGFASRSTVEAIERRVSAIEVDIRHLPTSDDVQDLRGTIADLAGEVREVRAEYRGIDRLVARVEASVTRHEAIFAEAAKR